MIFVIYPYHRNIARSLLKQPKVYFYDTGSLRVNDQGARLENAVACSLMKRLHFLEDTLGECCSLRYLRDKSKIEVDFLMTRNDTVEKIIEVKTSKPEITQLKHYRRYFKSKPEWIVLVKNLPREMEIEKIKVKRCAKWLSQLEA